MSLKSFWNGVKKFGRFNLADKVLPGYVFNKLIFKVGIALIFVWLLVAGYSLRFSWGANVYIHCPVGSAPCENPFYDMTGMNPNPTCLKYEICDRPSLLPGESFGSPPGFFFNHAGTFAVFIFLLMVLLNHFLYNFGYFKRKADEGKLA